MQSIRSAIFKTFLISLMMAANINFSYSQTASVLPPAKTTFLDNNGHPLSGGNVQFYIPSTTTPKTTWQDAAETIPNTNPVILDSAGRALILGSGSYRQIVKDQNNNIIWDQVTASAGSGGSTPTATGDGDLVGTIKPWAGTTAPNQYMFTYGQTISRTTFSALLTAITSKQAAFCTTGNPNLTGLSDTTNFWIGMTVEVSCVVGGSSTVISKTSTTVTLAANANVSTNTNATFFMWGNGNASTTFTLPDLRGLVPIGNNNMGGVASTNLTTTYFGSTNPNSIGAAGGGQTATLTTPNLPPYTPSGSVSGTAAITTSGFNVSGGVIAIFSANGTGPSPTTLPLTATFAGSAQGGTSMPFGVIPPSKTVNYIIKVTPDANSATASGVTDINGMIGSIACGTNITCTGNTITFVCVNFSSGANGCVPASGGGTTNFLRADGTWSPPAGAGGRIILSTPTSFYIATTGVDSAGCGLVVGSPCRTRGYLYNILASTYDFGNQAVTVNLAAGTYTDSLQASGALLIGQAGPSGLIFTGLCTSGHTSDVLIQPSGGVGYTYSADGGTSYRIQCQKLDQTTQVRAGNSNDMVVAGHGSKLYIGNPSLFGVRGDVTLGCNINPFNTFTIGPLGAYLEVDNDFTIDVSLCQVAITGTPTNGSAVIGSIANTTNIVRYMGIVATNVPNDAYVNSIVTNTSVTMACVYTSPCQANGSPGAETITFTGGGQAFLDMDSSNSFFITNGDPSFSIIGTLGGFPFYTSGWFFINDNSLTNAQAITWVNPGQGRGACSATENLSITNTNFQGIPYLPCNALQPQASPSSTVVAGNNTFTVSSATGIKLGMIASDEASPTATWTAGANTMVVSSNTGIVNGAKVTGAGILTGAFVTNISGTTITVGGCGGGPRCVTGSPLYISEAGTGVIFSNGLFSGGSVVTGISGTTITISDTIKNSGTAGNVWFQGIVTNFSLYK